MNCQEKLELQRKCTAAWDAYAAAAGKLGLPVKRAGESALPSASKRMALWHRVDFAEAYQSVMRLAAAHFAASRELSQHLTGHRC